jgi:hypothetical protein
MTDSNSPLPPAGWYPDPAGSNRTRWWNGFGWSDTYGEPAPTAAPAPFTPPEPAAAPGYGAAPVYGAAPTYSAAPTDGTAAGYGTAPAYGNAPAYASGPANGSGEQKAPAGTSPYTPFVWILALLPIVGLIDSAISLASFDRIVEEALDPNAPAFTPEQLLSGAVSWVVIGLTVLFGILDWRALKKAAVPNPFHWAWIFFSVIGVPVYMIGRSVVVRRRVGSGLAPMVVNLALIVAGFAIGVIAVIAGFSAVLDSGMVPGPGQ